MQRLLVLGALTLCTGCLDTVDENQWKVLDGLPDLGDGSVDTADGPRPDRQLHDGPLQPDAQAPDILAPDAPDPGACGSWSNYSCNQTSACVANCPTAGNPLFTINCNKALCVCTNNTTLASNTCATQATITCATCQNALAIGCCNGL